MAQTARKATQVARSIKQQAGDSTIASLEGRTTTETVRAARSSGLKTGNNFTGQYLYERFLMDKSEIKADVTKMDIVRQMVEVLDANGFDTVVAGMVSLAKKDADAAVTAAKAAGNFDSENPTWPIREANARLKTARNHQTVMRTAFGALKFCADELKTKLGAAELSYRMVREIGSKMLADKGIDWKGGKVEAPQDRAAKRAQETETAAMLAVQKEMPRREGESRAEYFARIDQATERKMAEITSTHRVEEMAKLAERIRALAGDNLPDIIDILLSADTAKPEVKPAADKNLH